MIGLAVAYLVTAGQSFQVRDTSFTEYIQVNSRISTATNATHAASHV